MKCILLGDMHVTKDNIDESKRVIEWTVGLCKEYDASIVLMGDQYHTMAVVRVEVSEFWDWAFRFINSTLGPGRSFSLTGNHDINSDGSSSALTVHKDLTAIIGNNPAHRISGTLGAIGYIRDNEAFLEKAWEMYNFGIRNILCHAEFDGAQYENGFYAPHGINLSKCPPVHFISGHIHKRQVIDGGAGTKVVYVGTPRYLSRSDIGEIKGVHFYDDSKSGSFGHITEFIATPANVSEPFVSLKFTEGQEIKDVPDSPRVYVDITGSKEYIKKALKAMPDNVKVRTFQESEKAEFAIKESEGLPVAFGKYTKSYFEQNKIEPATAEKVMSEILSNVRSLTQ